MRSNLRPFREERKGHDGKDVAYYFRIDAVLADEDRMLGLH